MRKDISSLDWTQVDLGVLQHNHSWVLPQLFAFFNQNVRLQRDESGKISSQATLRALHADLLDARVKFSSGKPATAEDLTRMIAHLNHAPRGEIIYGKQTTQENLRYNASVPLFLSIFKEYRDVPYEAWDYEDPKIAAFLDKDWNQVVPYLHKPLPEMDLLEIRELGRTIKSGTRQGKKTPYESCTAVTGIADPDFRGLPRLLKLQLCQFWVFHPQLRHPLSWTSHLDLDSAALPLVDTEVLVTTQKSAKISENHSLLPWQ